MRKAYIVVALAMVLSLACSATISFANPTPTPLPPTTTPSPLPTQTLVPTDIPTATPVPTVTVTATNTLPPGPYLYCDYWKTEQFAKDNNATVFDLDDIRQNAEANFKKNGNVKKDHLDKYAKQVQDKIDAFNSMYPPEYLVHYRNLVLSYLDQLKRAYNDGYNGDETGANRHLASANYYYRQIEEIAATVNLYCGPHYLRTH